MSGGNNSHCCVAIILLFIKHHFYFFIRFIYLFILKDNIIINIYICSMNIYILSHCYNIFSLIIIFSLFYFPFIHIIYIFSLLRCSIAIVLLFIEHYLYLFFIPFINTYILSLFWFVKLWRMYRGIIRTTGYIFYITIIFI